RITSESAIGSGVRRVEAVTGPGTVAAARQQEDLILVIARELETPIADLPRRIKQIAKDVQELKSEVGRLKRGGGGADGVDALVNGAKAIGAEKVVEARLESGQVDDARALMDELTKKRKIAAAILAVPGERPAFVIGVREDLVASKGLNAGVIAKLVGAACGGGGGGREFQAQAGASDASKIQLGFDTFEAVVRTKLA
ncbi:MAG TPA: DHHA1 domain-containing protein, partial [Planctomycetota bacterium]|nr:DHHA1 domain-containing protein [Planctomycetota bacterium]